MCSDPDQAGLIYDNWSRCHGLLRQDGWCQLRFVRRELLDTRSLREAVKDIDVVVHLAAKVSTPFASGDPHAFEQVNHWGTAELSYALESSDVQKVIYASSASVYGVSDVEKSTSDTPSPNTTYGISKLNGESMIWRLRNQMTTLVVRCANIYGYSPSIRFDAVINRFVRQAFFEGRISIEGRGDQVRPFIHIRHAAQIFKRLVTDFEQSAILNLVDQNRRIIDVANHLKDLRPDLEMMFVGGFTSKLSSYYKKSELFALYEHTPFEEEIQEA